jgi:hypothetical protein
MVMRPGVVYQAPTTGYVSLQSRIPKQSWWGSVIDSVCVGVLAGPTDPPTMRLLERIRLGGSQSAGCVIRAGEFWTVVDDHSVWTEKDLRDDDIQILFTPIP